MSAEDAADQRTAPPPEDTEATRPRSGVLLRVVAIVGGVMLIAASGFAVVSALNLAGPRPTAVAQTPPQVSVPDPPPPPLTTFESQQVVQRPARAAVATTTARPAGAEPARADDTPVPPRRVRTMANDRDASPAMQGLY